MDITPEELKQRLDENEAVNMIDVREQHERDEFNVGGILIPLGNLGAAMEEIPYGHDDEIVVYCKSGGRSGAAAQLLRMAGYKNVRNLTGGMTGYHAILPR